METQAFTPWPCCELTACPLDKFWSDVFPEDNLSRFRYAYIIQIVRSLFQRSEMSETYAMLRNYAFHQGAFTNACPMDLDFFYSMLAHDYPFFKGHKNSELWKAFDLDEKKYPGLPYLRASHYDLFRVERAGLGLAEIKSLTHGGVVHAFVSLFEQPHQGDILFARLMPLGLMPRGFAYGVVEPWDTVNPRDIDEILGVYQKQYQAFCAKFPGTSHQAFCKIAAYHIYELIQFYELREMLNHKLAPKSDELFAKTLRFRLTDKGAMPKLADIPGAQPVKDNGREVPDLMTASTCKDSTLDKSLTDAIISREGRVIEVTTFLKNAGEEYVKNSLVPFLSSRKYAEECHILDANETYRALRHLSLVSHT